MNDDEYRDLIERAHLVIELQRDPGWRVWQQHCQRRIEAKKREMVAGVPETIAEYRHTAGWIEGAEYVLDAVGTIERQRDRETVRRKEAKTTA